MHSRKNSPNRFPALDQGDTCTALGETGRGPDADNNAFPSHNDIGCPMPPPGRVHYSLPVQTIRRRYRVRFELSEFPKRFVGELGLA